MKLANLFISFWLLLLFVLLVSHRLQNLPQIANSENTECFRWAVEQSQKGYGKKRELQEICETYQDLMFISKPCAVFAFKQKVENQEDMMDSFDFCILKITRF